MNKLYEDYIRKKVHEQLIEMAKRMLEDGILSLEKIAEYSGLELAEVEDLKKDEQARRKPSTNAEKQEYTKGQTKNLIKIE